MMRVAMALLHHPVHDREGRAITTAVANTDIHDLARACRTYGVMSLFIVNPLGPQRLLAERLVRHWTDGYGGRINPHRAEALRLVHLAGSLAEVMDRLHEGGGDVMAITTSARAVPGTIGFESLRAKLRNGCKRDVALVLMGTGWGLTEKVHEMARLRLTPIRGNDMYNHLSVRSAAAVVLDRLLAPDRNAEQAPVRGDTADGDRKSGTDSIQGAPL